MGARRFSQMRPKGFSSFKESLAQQLDKSATGDLIGILAIVGVLKGQIAGDGQELPEGGVGNLAMGACFHSVQRSSDGRRLHAIYLTRSTLKNERAGVLRAVADDQVAAVAGALAFGQE